MKPHVSMTLVATMGQSGSVFFARHRLNRYAEFHANGLVAMVDEGCGDSSNSTAETLKARGVLTGAWRQLGSWLQNQQRRQSLGSWCVSAALHVTALGLCSLLLLSPPPRPRPPVVTTTWQERTPEQPILEALQIGVDRDARDAGGTSQGVVVFDPALTTAGESPALDAASVVMPDDDETASRLELTATVVGDSGGGGQGYVGTTGSGDGTNAGRGQGDGGGFFGLHVEGKRIIYVVDASRSMNHPHPGPAKTRFGRVKLELVRAIGEMNGDQQFFIVYFNDRAIPMPARMLKAAYPETQQKYLRWAVQAKADGMTDPEQALLLAISLEPDVIYFLTDGAFRHRVISEVARRNQGRVVINTIGFGDDEGAELLQAIATQNGGTYQFIPGDEAD